MDTPVNHTFVRGFDETKVVDLSVNAKRRNQTDIRTFRSFDGTQATVVSIVLRHETSKPARSRDRPPGPRADRRRLCVISASGLVWSMNCESWLVPKNELITDDSVRALISRSV